MKTLLVALLLLVGTGTASAECAWVLWGFPNGKLYDQMTRKPTTGSIPGPFIIGAYQTRTECMAQPARRAPDGGELVQGFSYSGADVLVAYTGECLPDTLDPRGAKGK